MKGNNLEIQRQIIEDNIVEGIDQGHRLILQPRAAQDSKIISIFDYITHKQPELAKVLKYARR